MKTPKLTSAEISHLIDLSSLSLTSAEQKKIEKQLTETLDYVQNLSEIKTDDVKTTDHTVDLKNEYFEDGSKNERKLSEKEIFTNSKKKKGNHFTVKKIL